jgi:hypothetical protein
MVTHSHPGVRVSVVVAVLALIATTAAAPVAVAQEANNTTTDTGTTTSGDGDDVEWGDGDDDANNTTTGTPANASAPGDGPDAGPGAKTLSRYTEVTDWEYTDGQWTITFETSEPVTVTLSQAGQAEEGATTFTIEQFDLERGTNTISFEAPRLNDEAQVSITSSHSVDEGRGVLLSTGQTGGSNPLGGTSATAGWVGGASVTTLMGLIAFRRRLKGGRGSPEEV